MVRRGRGGGGGPASFYIAPRITPRAWKCPLRHACLPAARLECRRRRRRRAPCLWCAGAAATNEDLVQNLRRGGVIQRQAAAETSDPCWSPSWPPRLAVPHPALAASPAHRSRPEPCLPACRPCPVPLPACSDRVRCALQLCARDLFVPAEHREEALVDAPIRVERLDFNISAPHMHATCLEALQLQPGHKVRGRRRRRRQQRRLASSACHRVAHAHSPVWRTPCVAAGPTHHPPAAAAACSSWMWAAGAAC